MVSGTFISLAPVHVGTGEAQVAEPRQVIPVG